MQKFLATLVLATLGASAALAQEAPASANAEAEIAAILQDYARATNELDLDLAEEIWSQEPGVSFIHPRGHQRGWPEIRQNFYVDTMGRLPKRRLEIGGFEVHLLTNDAAWCDFYWTFEASLPDGTRGLFLEVLVPDWETLYRTIAFGQRTELVPFDPS